jgi:uncharacterized protein YdaU (DUF1376 family)
VSSLPWYRWFPGDFAGNVRVRMMSWEARAAYRELLDASWSLGPIEQPEALLRALGLPDGLWEQVAWCWTETDGGWVNHRLEVEREQSRSRHDRAAKASAAATVRRAKGARNGDRDGDRDGDRKGAVTETATVTLSSPNQNQNQNQNQNTTFHQQQMSAREERSDAAAVGGGDERFHQEGLQ